MPAIVKNIQRGPNIHPKPPATQGRDYDLPPLLLKWMREK
jgi:hypothetical protein